MKKINQDWDAALASSPQRKNLQIKVPDEEGNTTFRYDE
jgi:hypothetical protein